jgi:hypothetical protein
VHESTFFLSEEDGDANTKVVVWRGILAAMKWLPKFYFFQRAHVTVRISVA